MNTKLTHGLLAAIAYIVVAALVGQTGEPAKPKFSIKVSGDPADLDGSAAIDSTRRINFTSQGNFFVNINTIRGEQLHLSHFPQFQIDGQVHQPGNDFMGVGRFEAANVPLKPLRGKQRNGSMTVYTVNNLRITQTMELHPEKAAGNGQKRRLNTVLITYTIENKDTKPHKTAARICMDTYVVTNDGCLFAAPTHPGKVLDGVILKDKTLPEYMQMLQVPDLKKPGHVTHLSLDMGGRYEKANKVVLSSLQVGFGDWEMAAAPANGDSAISFYWPSKEIRPGEKRELAYAYGDGIAEPPGSGGRFQMSLGGSMEPGKLFTIRAVVADPEPGQTLSLQLPAGIERVEGKELQSVPHLTDDNAYSSVFWKARVREPGEHTIRIQSSNGRTQTKIISVTPTK